MVSSQQYIVNPSKPFNIIFDAKCFFALIGNYVLQFADDFSYTDPVSLNLVSLRNHKT